MRLLGTYLENKETLLIHPNENGKKYNRFYTYIHVHTSTILDLKILETNFDKTLEF